METFTEVTAANLKDVRSSKKHNQAAVADLLGITQTAVSKIEIGQRGLSESEKSLLDWYFFGILPPRLENPQDIRGVLELTDQEWHVLTVMARREGQTPAQFIAATIRKDIHRDQEWPATAKLKVYANKAADDGINTAPMPEQQRVTYSTGKGNGAK
jgi:transcriptional regulator with XRE-family HTH domain